MRIKNRLIIFTTILCLIQGLTAQEYSDIQIGRRYQGEFVEFPRVLNYSDIDGSPYAIKDLIQGFVFFHGGDSAVNYLRYNIYEDEMEYLEGNKIKVVMNPYIVKKIYLNDKEYLYKDFLVGLRREQGYMITEVTGSCSVYRRMNVEFEDAKPPASSYDKSTPPTFKRLDDSWLISMGDNPPREFGLSKKVLLEVFGNESEELESYAKKNNLKVRKPEDFLEIVRYYNEKQGN